MTAVIETDIDFGGCPKCGHLWHIVNVGKAYAASCEEHQTFWWIGERHVDPDWPFDDAATCEKNAALLATYREIKPIFPVRCARCGRTGRHSHFCRYFEGTLTPLSDEVVLEMTQREDELAREFYLAFAGDPV